MIDRGRLAVLAELVRALPDRSIVVIGAVAIDWHYGPGFRVTEDLDLCISIDLAEHSSVGFPAGWQRLPRLPHRWRLPDGQLVDIVPAAESLLAAGQVTWPDGTSLDLTGIDLAMHDALRCDDSLPEAVRVASRRALFVTKVAAWLDRPGDRVKDLVDLGLLLDRYVEDDDARLFDEPSLDRRREFDERPAWLLGLDLRPVCTDRHLARIRSFLSLVGDPGRPQHHWMTRAAPTSWQRDDTAVARRCQALAAGLGL